MKKHLRLLVIPALLISSLTGAQEVKSVNSRDSLSLTEAICKIVSTYPSILKADNDIETFSARIALAKSAFLPNIEANALYSHIGPVSEITLQGLGSFSLNPADNYSAAISVSQLVADFGKSKRSVEVEQINSNIAKLTSDQLKQRLSISGAASFYSMLYLSEAVKIKEEEIANLNEHLRYVQKKTATGSATDYQILATEVRISTAENQRTDLINSLNVQRCYINLLMGLDRNNMTPFKKEISELSAPKAEEELIETAFANREEVKIAAERIDLTSAKMKQSDAQNNPSLSLLASGGVKNGYIPDQMALKANYSVGAGLKVPIFDANRTKYNKRQIDVEAKSASYDLELSKLSIVNEVVECRANVESALKRVRQSQLQLVQAQRAYRLAKTSFEAGSITNLDLLDASTTLSESKLNLLNSKIDYTLNSIRLKVATGEKIYR